MGPNFSGSSVEQIHQFHQWSEENPDMNLQHQSSCNEPRRNPAPAPSLENFKESEVQLSTGSCPGERLLKELDACSRSSLRPNGVSRRGSELNEVSQQPTRAIKVVPHNRRSATKSAARIFRSIQEERRLHE
ncbi:hypothetical protein CDL15_Pgr022194 [Punica granatum]|uniref:Uncharacterized protein n=1 Tax=Punica granatum TaxID=22663 RepID=A0A218VT41_PUNGR|nr:hypothetical protein CDL15_Pgr022194 [Punica granatum]